MAFQFGAALAVFLAAGSAPGTSGPATPAMVQQIEPAITPGILKSLLASEAKPMLIDVRGADEYAAGHIDGAVLMPLDTLSASYAQLPRNVRLVVYCRSGRRSAQAVAFLQAHGYRLAVTLEGGITAWNAQNVQ